MTGLMPSLTGLILLSANLLFQDLDSIGSFGGISSLIFQLLDPLGGFCGSIFQFLDARGGFDGGIIQFLDVGGGFGGSSILFENNILQLPDAGGGGILLRASSNC